VRENWSAVSATAEAALPHDLRFTGVLALSNSRALRALPAPLNPRTAPASRKYSRCGKIHTG
jgi:hypothetical protein